jgi:diaminohydroxyphosphoribosylaminopyrimidine deaminase / 5-amino-6-(5-phosphoribosylamino)uracil reductase
MSSADDDRWMALAVDLAWRSPPSDRAYRVGAVIVAADGTELSRGFSREDHDQHVHAEEAALGKLAGDPRLAGATIYSTLEPCSERRSRPRSCTQLIIGSGIGRVVFAWREPSLFVADCRGAELLEQAGLSVTELHGFAEKAAAPNRHLSFLSRLSRTSGDACLHAPDLAVVAARHRCAAMCEIGHFLRIAASSCATDR